MEREQVIPSAGVAFKRAYYSAATAMLAAALCLPFLVPIAFALAGFDPAVQHEYTPESFHAYRETAPFRRGFLAATGWVALLVMALSITVLVMRYRGKLDVPWPAAVVILVIAMCIAGVAGLALIVPTSGMLG